MERDQRKRLKSYNANGAIRETIELVSLSRKGKYLPKDRYEEKTPLSIWEKDKKIKGNIVGSGTDIRAKGDLETSLDIPKPANHG